MSTLTGRTYNNLRVQQLCYSTPTIAKHFYVDVVEDPEASRPHKYHRSKLGVLVSYRMLALAQMLIELRIHFGSSNKTTVDIRMVAELLLL